MDDNKTPVGLAILLAAVGWLSSQVATGLQERLLLSYDARPGTDRGGPILDFLLMNESANRTMQGGSFSLFCPDQKPKCFRPAFNDALNKFADPVVLPPWNVGATASGSDDRIGVWGFSLPAGAILDVQVGLIAADVQPILAFDVPRAGTVSDLQIFRQPFWSGWVRNYVWILAAVWAVLFGIILAWVLTPLIRSIRQ